MSIWQQKAWWEMLVKSGQAEKIFEIDRVFVEKRKVSFWEYWLFVIWLDKTVSFGISEKLVELCKKENCLFVQLETIDYTNFLKYWENLSSSNNLSHGRGKYPEGGMGVFKIWFYKKFITPYTATIDLTKSEEEILSDMKQKGRYNIRLAEKKWVEVKIVEKIDENINKFYDLMMETTSRDGFSWNTLNYYKIFLSSLDSSKLFLAYKDNKVISAWIFVFEGDIAIYYYWASTWDKEYRNLMAPYLVQWEAIKYAKSAWCKIYDFLGVATPWDVKSSLAWVTDFKLKLTQDVKNVSEAYIWINKKLKYFLINMIRKIKK